MGVAGAKELGLEIVQLPTPRADEGEEGPSSVLDGYQRENGDNRVDLRRFHNASFRVTPRLLSARFFAMTDDRRRCAPVPGYSCWSGGGGATVSCDGVGLSPLRPMGSTPRGRDGGRCGQVGHVPGEVGAQVGVIVSDDQCGGEGGGFAWPGGDSRGVRGETRERR